MRSSVETRATLAARRRPVRTTRGFASADRAPEGSAAWTYATLLDEIPNGVFVTDEECVVRFWNPAAERITGWSVADAVGAPTVSRLGIPSMECVEIREAVATDGRWTGERDLFRKDGSPYPATISITALPAQGDRPAGCLGVLTDATERVEAARRVALANERLEVLLGSGPAVIYSDQPVAGFPNTFTSANAEAILGLSPALLAGSGFTDRIHPSDLGRVREGLDELLAAGHNVQEYRFLHGDGRYRRLRDEHRIVRGPDGEAQEIVGYLADVTAQHDLADERLRLAAAMDQTSDAVVMVDVTGTITYANASFCEITGRTRDDLLDAPASDLATGDLEPLYVAAMRSALTGQSWTGSARVAWQPDRPADLDIAVWPLLVDGVVGNIVGVFRDATVERSLGAALKRQTDERAALMESLSRLRSGATVEETAAGVAAELLDVSGLDLVMVVGYTNGTGVVSLAHHGRLRDVAGHLLRGCGAYLRSSGGVVLEDWGEHRTAHDSVSCGWGATGLSAMLMVPLVADGGSIGAVLLGTAEVDGGPRLRQLEPLVTQYAAVTAAMVAPGWAERRRSTDERAAIAEILERRAFSTVFQPVVEIVTRTVVGYEALTRFNDNTAPDVRFKQAAAVGLGLDLEEATLAAAIAHGRGLPRGLTISLNVSPQLVLERGRLKQLLGQAKSRRVVLEITEHAAVEDYAQLRRAARSLGSEVEIAVDDAGAGFSSLRHIAELRPSYVKLDMGLIHGVSRDPARQGLIAGMAHFAVETGCVLVAEGIETASELRALRRLGVTFGQGFFLGRPEPIRDA